jgi:hypothetical protein
MTRLDYLFRQYENVLGWYKQSEEKAKFIVTVNTLVVGVVNGLVFVAADKVRDVGLVYTVPIWVLLALSGLAPVGSYVFILRAMRPRHHVRDALMKDSDRMWFFKHEAINWAIAFAIVALILLFALGVAYGIAVTNTPRPKSV